MLAPIPQKLVHFADPQRASVGVVNVSQIATLDKRQLAERVGRLSTALLDALDSGIRLALDVA